MAKYALLIGVSEYGEGIPPLSAPPNDVAAMQRVLENPDMGNFDQVIPLINPDLITMNKAIETLFKQGKKEDLILLYFSGHGFTDDQSHLYLTNKNSEKNSYQATCIPANFIQGLSINCHCKRQIIILDCCYSGAFKEGWKPKDLGLNLEQELGAEGRVVLTSSSATQKSFEQDGSDLAVYTKYLVEGIATGAADHNQDGKIYITELHQYAKKKVLDEKPNMKPEIINDREGYQILISKAPVNDPKLKYRQWVEKYAIQGKITTVGKTILKTQQGKLGISDAESEQIIEEVLAPYLQRLENIKIYQEALTEAIAESCPLSERLINELQDLQDILGLKDEDLAEFKQQMFDPPQPPLEKGENEDPPKILLERGENLILKTDKADFHKLDQLLAAQQYQEADQETTKLMLQIGDPDDKGYLTVDNIKAFPVDDLRTIDQLWLKYSDNKFGFSVQKQIWLDCGGKLDDNYDWATFEKFSDRIGWRKNGSFINYPDDYTFNTNALQGHLPGLGRVRGGWGYYYSFLLSKL